MTDYFARQRQLIGTTAEWAANDLIIGLGEFAIEIVGPLHNRLKLGDGINRYSALPYYDPGINQFVRLAGDTMSGALEVPQLDVTGPATFTGTVALGTAATVGEPPSLSDADNTVPTTHWVQQQIGGVISGLHLLGAWNAATNDPTLQNGGAGTPPNVRGDFYLVSVSGSTTLDGISTWSAGDSCVFNGVTWQRVPQTLTNVQIVAGLGYVPVNVAGDTMTGPLAGITEPAGSSNKRFATTEFLAAALAAFMPAGAIMDFAGNAAPSGWLMCNGQSVTTAAFNRLFVAIGYQYGGSGANFNVPDLCGRVTAGMDNMGGITAKGRLTNATVAPNGTTLGAVGGEQTHVLTVAELAAHKHSAGYNFMLANGLGTGLGTAAAGSNFNLWYTDGTDTIGGSGAHNNQPPTMVLNKIIKA